MLPDHGPLYLETDLSRLPAEPWATYSQLLFVAVVIYWAWRIRGQARSQRFIAWCLPLLLVQSVGSMTYHALRSHLGWMLLDVIPLYLVCVLAAGYLWRRFGLSRLLAVIAALVPSLGGAGLTYLLALRGHLGQALTYGGVFLAILVPAFALLPRLRPERRFLPWTALAALILALFFRSVDLQSGSVLPGVGTHWLWHAFGAAAVHLLIWNVYELDEKRA